MSYSLAHPYSSLTETVLRRYVSEIFIETGTNIGRAIEVALNVGFTFAWSVEEDAAMHAMAVQRVGTLPGVTLYHGDSPSFLRRVLPEVPAWCQATIYLDAHSIERNPLLEELRAIEETAKGRRHIILIDDVRMFGTPDWHGLRLEEALEILNRIDSFDISYDNTNHGVGDLLVARPR